MVTHRITVRGRRLSGVPFSVVQGCRSADALELDLDGEWDGMSVVLVLGPCGGATELAWHGEPLTLPSALAEDTGGIDVSVVGYSADGDTRLVTVAAPSLLNVIKSGCTVGEAPAEETPDLIGQLVAAGDAANKAAQAANTASTSANGAAGKAITAASEANTEASNANAAAAAANGAADDATVAAQNALNIANSIAAIEPPSDDEVQELRDANAVLATAVAELQDDYVIINETAYMPASRRSALSGETLTVAQASMSGETATLN